MEEVIRWEKELDKALLRSREEGGKPVLLDFFNPD